MSAAVAAVTERRISVETAVRTVATVLIGIVIAIMGWVLSWTVNSIIDQGKEIAAIKEKVRHQETMRAEVRRDLSELGKKIDRLLEKGNDK